MSHKIWVQFRNISRAPTGTVLNKKIENKPFLMPQILLHVVKDIKWLTLLPAAQL